MDEYKILDVHHHLSPPAHLKALKDAGLGRGPELDWFPDQSIAQMAAAGIDKSLLSVSTPAVTFLDTRKAIRVARESNEYAARLQSDYPDHFGFFATVPMPDTDATIREISYSLDELGASGISLLTSYRNVWLGSAQYDPVMDVLNQRHAVVHVHPTAPDCCLDVLPSLSRATIEYPTDTTRAIANIIFGGSADRYPEIQYIFSHGGGTMPFLIERFTTVPTRGRFSEFSRESVLSSLRRFSYDTALISNPGPLSALVHTIPISQIVFGSDYPYRSAEDTATSLHSNFSNDDLRRIGWDNATRLLAEGASLDFEGARGTH